MSESLGYFGLVLHGHIPWCKKSGIWPTGEEWLMEAINESYIPLLNVLRELKEIGLRNVVTINITPILAEQLADKYMKQRFSEYMENLIRRAEADVERYSNYPERKKIAEFSLNNFRQILENFHHNYYRDILGTFKWLQDERIIELITCGATHGFLPLFKSDSGVFSQIQLAVDTYKKYFKKVPKGFWLPECAYRPKEYRDGKVRESIDYWLNNSGIEYFFVDSHGILTAEIIEKNNEIGLNTNFGYILETGVSTFGRNKDINRQVWDSKIGYPGDSNYREFHMKDPESGLHYWKITNKLYDQKEKQLYNPEVAQDIVKSHAHHFLSLLNKELSNFNQQNTIQGIVVSPYDFELFGHWWMEGIEWLKNVIELINKSSEIGIITISDYLSKYRENFSVIRMKESSWGEGGDFRVWKDPEHGWIWPYINGSIREFENILKMNPNPHQREERILKQIARELLLMEGSDWPFLLYTRQAKEYANQRFHHHHQRFNKLLWAAKDVEDEKRISIKELDDIEKIDSCFREINLDYFKRI